MNLKELLLSKELTVPARCDISSFQHFVDTRIQQYIDLVERLDPSDARSEIAKYLEHIKDFKHSIVHAFAKSHRGLFHESNLSFFKGMDCFGEIFAKFKDESHQKALDRTMFRLRVSTEPNITERSQIFHIPFQHRRLVRPQRFSVTGVPSLYLGGSSYVCWLEMGRPAFDTLYAAAYWFPKRKSEPWIDEPRPEPQQPDDIPSPLELLDLSLVPAKLLEMLDGDGAPQEVQFQSVVIGILLWPIIFLSSIKAEHLDAAFKREYLFPQMLLHWIMSSQNAPGFEGVIYQSTKLGPHAKGQFEECNVVVPAKSIEDSGFCETLRTRFRLTRPVHWELLRAGAIRTYNTFTENNLYKPQLIPGILEPYQNTEFGRIDHALRQYSVMLSAGLIDGDTGHLERE